MTYVVFHWFVHRVYKEKAYKPSILSIGESNKYKKCFARKALKLAVFWYSDRFMIVSSILYRESKEEKKNDIA